MESNWRWAAATFNPGSPFVTLFARRLPPFGAIAISNALGAPGTGLSWTTSDGGLLWDFGAPFFTPGFPHFPFGVGVEPDH